MQESLLGQGKAKIMPIGYEHPVIYPLDYADQLRNLYWHDGLSVRQIAKLKCMSGGGITRQFKKYGIPLRPQVAPAFNRLMAKIIKEESGCWRWSGKKDANGYGRIWFEGKETLTHIVSYRLLVGEIPEGLELDHLCRNTSCVNPEHLEAVTHRQNMERGININILSHRLGVCRRGHSLQDAFRDKRGNVAYCRTCRNEKRRVTANV